MDKSAREQRRRERHARADSRTSQFISYLHTKWQINNELTVSSKSFPIDKTKTVAEREQRISMNVERAER